MISVQVFDNFDNKCWNELVSSVPQGTLFQTTYWAEYLKKSLNAQPYYLIAEEDGDVKGIFLFWIKQIDIARYFPKINISMQLLSKVLRLNYGFCMYGPLIFDKEVYSGCIDKLFNLMDKICKDKKVIMINQFIPPLTYSLDYDYDKNNRVLHSNALEKGYIGTKWATLYIDLSKDLTTLWQGLKKYTRKDVNKSLKYDIKVEFLKKEELSIYKQLVIESRQRIGVEIPPHYPDLLMWECLKENKDGRNCLEILVARFEGKIIGAVVIFEYNGIIFQGANCQSNYSYEKKMNVNDLLTWEIIKWGRENNKRVFDLSGIHPSPVSAKEKGIRQYKEKWSENRIEYNHYKKTYRKNIQLIANIAKSVSSR